MINPTKENALLETISLLDEGKLFKQISEKIIENDRISDEEGILLFERASLGLAATLANYIREKKHGDKTYFNRNFHIEPTNVCVFSCKFCSYSRLYAHRDEGWQLSHEQMLDIVKSYDGKPVTEVHIVGGVHPKMDLDFFCNLISDIKTHRPDLHIKGFTAVELDYMFRKAKLTVEEGMLKLKTAGLQSLPGGGAEIFDEEIRQQISADKVDAEGWLKIHEAAHKLGMHTNATMLYGHIENAYHRIDHLLRLRELQDETGGFQTFIPLAFHPENTGLAHIKKPSAIMDLRTIAVSRLMLDNIPHIKAYWIMLGIGTAQTALAYGADDLDGTVRHELIYHDAGATTPELLTCEQIQRLIVEAGREPIERDTLYRRIVRDAESPARWTVGEDLLVGA